MDEDQAIPGLTNESGEDYLYPTAWFVSVDVPENAEQLLHELAAK